MDAGRNILKDEQRRFARLKSAQHAAALNLIVYGGLTVAELWIAQLAHSRALAADGLNNLTGVASALILLWVCRFPNNGLTANTDLATGAFKPSQHSFLA